MRRRPSGREFLLKGKDQYGWPPCTSSDRRWFRSAASNPDLFFFFKTSSRDEEVNRTEPSPSVRVPCLGSYQNALNNQKQRKEHFLTQKYKKIPKDVAYLLGQLREWYHRHLRWYILVEPLKEWHKTEVCHLPLKSSFEKLLNMQRIDNSSREP